MSPAMHATVVQCGVRAGVSKEQFWTFVTGKVSPLVKGVFHPALCADSTQEAKTVVK